ncbi:hypothetical protein ACLB2K_052603 [Fragaria x ananassa]
MVVTFKWKQSIELYLGLQGIDWCLTEAEPVIDDNSSELETVKHKEWTRANRMTKLILKQTMTDVVRGSIADKDTATEFMAAIALKFRENEKAEISFLLDQLMGVKYDSSKSVREHIMRIIDITTRLGDLEISLPSEFVVHQSLRTLPASFEEDMIKRDGQLVVNLVSKSKWKGKGKVAEGKATASSATGSGEEDDLEEVEQEPEPQNLQDVQVDAGAPPQQLRRSGRVRKPAINTQEYIVYLQEAEFDWGEEDDPVTFSQAVESDQRLKWIEVMEAELKSMYDNNVWELVEPIGSHKPIGCKWIFKTKRCDDGSVE